MPICFALEYNLFADATAVFGKDALPFDTTFDSALVLEVITKERLCSAFTPWQQGFTPKEHREMLDRQELLRWQADREDADRTWRTKEAKRERRWRRKQASSEVFWRWVQILVFGVAGAIVAIAAAVIQKS